jgi:hypothetical protein
VGLERGPLSLVSTTEDLLGRKSSGSGLENREEGRRDPSHFPRGSFCTQKLALISPTSGGRSVGAVPSRAQAADFTSVLTVLDPVFLRINTAAVLRIDDRHSSPGRVKNLHLSISSGPALGPTQTNQWVREGGGGRS